MRTVLRTRGPKELKLELTRTCPLRCLHCSVNGCQASSARMTPEAASRIVREFADLGGETLVLTGGEPLCYSHVCDIAMAAKRESLTVFLYTTGLKVGDAGIVPAFRELEQIADAVNTFIFCIHGANAGSHDLITGVHGSFCATLSVVKGVLSWGKPVVIHHVPLSPNVGELLAVFNLVSEIGLSSLKILRFVAQGRGERNRDRLELGLDGTYFLREQLEIARASFPGVSVDLGSPYSMLDESSGVTCSAGEATLSVSASLDCSPCDGFKCALGGIFNEPLASQSLAEFWSASPMLMSIRRIRDETHHVRYRGCLAQEFLALGHINGFAGDPLAVLADETAGGMAMASHPQCPFSRNV